MQTAVTFELDCWCSKQVILYTQAKALQCRLDRALQLALFFRILDAQSMPSMPTAAGRVTCECLSTSWRSQGFIFGGSGAIDRKSKRRLNSFAPM